MSDTAQKIIFNSLRAMLRPIARFCLKHSIGIQELLDSSKRVFVEVAAEELERQNEKVTVSRLSVMTGLQRPAVKSYQKPEEEINTSRFTSRVIGQWRRDARFLTQNGRPRVLSTEGDESEFKHLVHLVSTDLHPRTVLFDLERLGVVELTRAGVRLKAKAYSSGKNEEESYRMLGRDMDELMGAVMDNLESEHEMPNFHAYTYFDNLPKEDISKIQRWLLRQSSQFHQRVERYLSQFDLDINPNPKKTGGQKIAMGSFTRLKKK